MVDTSPGAPPNPKRGINLQEKLFCEFYVAQAPYFHLGKAATAAGYSKPQSAGSRLMIKPAIQAYIEDLRRKAAMRNNIRLDDIINELAKIAFRDIRGYYTEDGQLKKITDLTDKEAAALEGWEVDEIKEWLEGNSVVVGVNKKIKLTDKLKALDMLRDCLGFKEMQKSKTIRRNAQGEVIETETTEGVSQDDKIIFEDHTGGTPNADLSI